MKQEQNQLINFGNNNLNGFKWVKTPKNLNIAQPYIQGKIITEKENGNKIVLSIRPNPQSKQQEITVNSNQVYDMFDSHQLVDDMANMNILNEPSILDQLIKRYQKDQMFTYIGPILIAINPYQKLPHLFDQEKIQKTKRIIRECIMTQQNNLNQPHVYSLTGQAYIHMERSSKKQAIVISGQSGAGKTQQTKYCLKLLTALNNEGNNTQIAEKITSSNPIFQAFGNSKTVRNENSSRFGKLIQILYDQKNTITGANIKSYLLQKSRVVSVAEGQRNFHAFYSLIASGEYTKLEANEYEFLSASKCYVANGRDDKKQYEDIVQSMKALQFTDYQIEQIWLVLKCILELGNIKFDDKQNKINQNNPCTIINRQLLKPISDRLNISSDYLQNVLLIQNKIFLKQIIKKPYLGIQGCTVNRNNLCKSLYNQLFDFIVFKIQKSLNCKSHAVKSISILDIFGFQNFDTNSLEQLCINYTNQKLLKLYNQYVFQKQIKLLKQDGLEEEVKSISFPTNVNIISLISHSPSLFSLINDNTKKDSSLDKTIWQSFQNLQQKTKNKDFKAYKAKLKDSFNQDILLFKINHSPCQIQYNVKQFKTKNLDKINDDLLKIVNALPQIITGRKSTQQQEKVLTKIQQKKENTLLKKFASQIDVLTKQLSQSNVHFIRCVKPNMIKQPKQPQSNYILIQLRYLGVLQTIKIRQSTFPIRKYHQQFVHEYKILIENQIIHNAQLLAHKKQEVLLILKTQKCDPNEYKIGRQRVYMNQQVQRKLNRKVHLIKLKKHACRQVKKMFKSYLLHKITQVCQRTAGLKTFIRAISMFIGIKSINRKKQAFLCINQFSQAKKQQIRMQQQLRLEYQNRMRIQEQRIRAQTQRIRRAQEQRTRTQEYNNSVPSPFKPQIQPLSKQKYNSISTTFESVNITIQQKQKQQASTQTQEQPFQKLQKTNFQILYINAKSRCQFLELLLQQQKQLIFQRTQSQQRNKQNLQQSVQQQYQSKLSSMTLAYQNQLRNVQKCQQQIKRLTKQLHIKQQTIKQQQKTISSNILNNKQSSINLELFDELTRQNLQLKIQIKQFQLLRLIKNNIIEGLKADNNSKEKFDEQKSGQEIIVLGKVQQQNSSLSTSLKQQVQKLKQSIDRYNQQIDSLKMLKNKLQEKNQQLKVQFSQDFINTIKQTIVTKDFLEVVERGNNNPGQLDGSAQNSQQQKKNYAMKQMPGLQMNQGKDSLLKMELELKFKKKQFVEFYNQIIKQEENTKFDSSVFKQYLRLLFQYIKSHINLFKIQKNISQPSSSHSRSLQSQIQQKQRQTQVQKLKNNQLTSKILELNTKINQLSTKITLLQQQRQEKNILTKNRRQRIQIYTNVHETRIQPQVQMKIEDIIKVNGNKYEYQQVFEQEQNQEQQIQPSQQRRGTFNFTNTNNQFKVANYRNSLLVNNQTKQFTQDVNKIKKQLSLQKNFNKSNTQQLLKIQKQNKQYKDNLSKLEEEKHHLEKVVAGLIKQKQRKSMVDLKVVSEVRNVNYEKKKQHISNKDNKDSKDTPTKDNFFTRLFKKQQKPKKHPNPTNQEFDDDLGF